MEAWMAWLALAGIVVILEMFTGTFYLLMITVGLIAGAATAAIFPSVQIQMLVAALVGAGATVLLHNSKYGWKERKDAATDPNVNIDIGQQLTVTKWTEKVEGIFVARAKYRGAMWDIELHSTQSEAGEFVINEVQGSRLIVKPV